MSQPKTCSPYRDQSLAGPRKVWLWVRTAEMTTWLQSELKGSAGCLAFVPVPCLLVDFLNDLAPASCQGGRPTIVAERSRRAIQAVWFLPFLSFPTLPHRFPESCCENKGSQITTTSPSFCPRAAPTASQSPNSPPSLPHQHVADGKLWCRSSKTPADHSVDLCSSWDQR